MLAISSDCLPRLGQILVGFAGGPCGRSAGSVGLLQGLGSGPKSVFPPHSFYGFLVIIIYRKLG